MKCKDLKQNQEVIFRIYSSIRKERVYEVGNVLFVNDDSVCVIYLDGYKSRTERIPCKDMVAVYDKDGAEYHFNNIHGPSILLEDGYFKNHTPEEITEIEH